MVYDMGLDITARNKLRKAEKPDLDKEGYVNDYTRQWKPGASMEWSEKCFPGRGEGVEINTVYEWESSYSFRAGSYSGYGIWRSSLNNFKGDVAFQELINFADNEGVIGPVVSKKLYEDFVKYEKEAEQYSEDTNDDGWFIENYRDWLEAFKLASDGGAVEFG